MNQESTITPNSINDLQGLEIETFKVEELDGLDVDAGLSLSLCSSTTSSSCG